jgi:hypothetical protein
MWVKKKMETFERKVCLQGNDCSRKGVEAKGGLAKSSFHYVALGTQKYV